MYVLGENDGYRLLRVTGRAHEDQSGKVVATLSHVGLVDIKNVFPTSSMSHQLRTDWGTTPDTVWKFYKLADKGAYDAIVDDLHPDQLEIIMPMAFY